MFGIIMKMVATPPTVEMYEFLLREKDRVIRNLCSIIHNMANSSQVTVINMDMPKTVAPTALPTALLTTDEEMPRNIIFRKFIDGKPIDMRKMKHWIETHFIGHYISKYEWFALWRVLIDLHYIAPDMSKVSKFVDQMQAWFPDETGNNLGSEINRYRRGYLGDTPYPLWERSKFEAQMGKKQSELGFIRLNKLCNDLWNELKGADMKTS